MLRTAVVLATLGLVCASFDALAAAPYIGVPPQGNAHAGAGLVTTCAACHGTDGNSIAPTFPNLAGQNYNYLLGQLEEFGNGTRTTQPMSTMIKTVPPSPNDQNLKNLAAYFSAQKLKRPAPSAAGQPSKSVIEEGYRIFAAGIGNEQVPACAACHGATGEGNAPMAIPALAGQHATYVIAELQHFASGQRHDSPGHVMGKIAARLKPDEIKAVAAYVHLMRPDLMFGVGPKSYAAYVKVASKLAVPGIPASEVAASEPHK